MNDLMTDLIINNNFVRDPGKIKSLEERVNADSVKASEYVLAELGLDEDDLYSEGMLYVLNEKIELNGDCTSSLDNLFKGCLFYILSAAQDYSNNIRVYKELESNNLVNPYEILDPINNNALTNILDTARFNNNKKERVFKFADWWINSEIPEGVIIEACDKKLHKYEFELRDDLTRAPGIGPKIASLILSSCDYERVVALDIWILKYLDKLRKEKKNWKKHFKGLKYHIPIPDYKTNGGLYGKKYLEIERVFSKIARKEFELSPSHFRRLVWFKAAVLRQKF
jgi:thermostable 8-oxoguanine DNA glycosylase